MFIIYINDLDGGISSNFSKYGYDTMIGRCIRSDNDARILRGEIDGLCEWSNKWMIHFNIDRGSELSAGEKNLLGNTAIRRTASVKGLGVHEGSFLNLRNSYIIAQNREPVLGFDPKKVSNRSSEVILRVYLTLVGPHLDYDVQLLLFHILQIWL